MFLIIPPFSSSAINFLLTSSAENINQRRLTCAGFSLRRLRELAVVELGVEAVLLHQLLVRAALDDVAVAHHEDEVGVLDGRQSSSGPSSARPSHAE